MNTYSIALFLHISGALGFFIVQGVEWIGLAQLRKATRPEEASAVLGILKRSNGLGVASMSTIFITGFYMVLTVWHFVPWIIVMLSALVVEIILFVAVGRPRLAAIERTYEAEKGTLSLSFHGRVNDPVLGLSVRVRTAILLGMVCLKVFTPDLRTSLVVIGAAILLGLASALPEFGHVRIQPRSPTRTIITFTGAVSVAALALLAANSVSAGIIDLAKKTRSDIPGAQTTEVASSDSPTQAPGASSQVAPQEGRFLLQTRCTQCHSLQKILQDKKTRTDWEETLSKMEGFNVTLSDSEKEALLDYLTTVDQP